MLGFIHHHRPFAGHDFSDKSLPALFMRRKTHKNEFIRRNAGNGQSRGNGRRPGHGFYAYGRFMNRPYAKFLSPESKSIICLTLFSDEC